MKKLLAVLAIALLVVGTVTIFSMAEKEPAQTPPAQAGTEPPAAQGGAGSVYYLNFKPEQAQQWQAVAKTYTALTGVPVTVVTAASGTYEDTLRSEMERRTRRRFFRSTAPWGFGRGRTTAWTCGTRRCIRISKATTSPSSRTGRCWASPT